jgi:calcineurin-like phosphoesterase family protein
MSIRKGQRGAELLQATVDRLNADIKPDVTVVLGDLVDDPDAADAPELLAELREIIEQLDSPWLAIKGNHDPAETFYDVIGRVECLDINGVRLVAFDDPERPGYNACREPAGFDRMATFAAGHDGPLIALQHVPVGEPRVDAPHGYTNAGQVLDAMRQHGYTLAISGHSHAGVPLRDHAGVATLVVPALCEPPFQFGLVTIDGDQRESQRFTL